MQLSVEHQKKLFPPMMNTLYIETEVESRATGEHKHGQRSETVQSNSRLKSDHFLRVENEMKSKITEIYNETSKFFWYPPKALLTERTLADKEMASRNLRFPGFGLSYTKSSLPEGQRLKRKLLNNSLNTDANARHIPRLRSENCEDYLKSGQLSQLFKIKVKQVGNLIRVLEDLNTGNNAIIDIHEHKYLDTMYEMKYGYDLILDSVNAKEECRRRQQMEAADKQKEKESLAFIQGAAAKYNSFCKSTLNRNQYTQLIQHNTKALNFQNSSNNNIALTKAF
jgi:hypothetical protein